MSTRRTRGAVFVEDDNDGGNGAHEEHVPSPHRGDGEQNNTSNNHGGGGMSAMEAEILLGGQSTNSGPLNQHQGDGGAVSGLAAADTMTMDESWLQLCSRTKQHFMMAISHVPPDWQALREKQPDTFPELRLHAVVPADPQRRPSPRILVDLEATNWNYEPKVLEKLAQDLTTALERVRATTSAFSVRFCRRGDQLTQMVVDLVDLAVAEGVVRELQVARYQASFGRLTSPFGKAPSTTISFIDFRGALNNGQGLAASNIENLLTTPSLDVRVIPGFEPGVFYATTKSAAQLYCVLRHPLYSGKLQQQLLRNFGILMCAVECKEPLQVTTFRPPVQYTKNGEDWTYDQEEGQQGEGGANQHHQVGLNANDQVGFAGPSLKKCVLGIDSEDDEDAVYVEPVQQVNWQTAPPEYAENDYEGGLLQAPTAATHQPPPPAAAPLDLYSILGESSATTPHTAEPGDSFPVQEIMKSEEGLSDELRKFLEDPPQPSAAQQQQQQSESWAADPQQQRRHGRYQGGGGALLDAPQRGGGGHHHVDHDEEFVRAASAETKLPMLVRNLHRSLQRVHSFSDKHRAAIAALFKRREAVLAALHEGAQGEAVLMELLTYPDCAAGLGACMPTIIMNEPLNAIVSAAIAHLAPSSSLFVYRAVLDDPKVLSQVLDTPGAIRNLGRMLSYAQEDHQTYLRGTMIDLLSQLLSSSLPDTTLAAFISSTLMSKSLSLEQAVQHWVEMPRKSQQGSEPVMVKLTGAKPRPAGPADFARVARYLIGRDPAADKSLFGAMFGAEREHWMPILPVLFPRLGEPMLKNVIKTLVPEGDDDVHKLIDEAVESLAAHQRQQQQQQPPQHQQQAAAPQPKKAPAVILSTKAAPKAQASTTADITKYPSMGAPYPPLPDGFVAKTSVTHMRYYFVETKTKSKTYQHPTNGLEYPVTAQALFHEFNLGSKLLFDALPGMRRQEIEKWIADQKHFVPKLTRTVVDAVEEEIRIQEFGATLVQGVADPKTYPASGNPFPRLPPRFEAEISVHSPDYIFKDLSTGRSSNKHPKTDGVYPVTPQAMYKHCDMNLAVLSDSFVREGELAKWLEDQRTRHGRIDTAVRREVSRRHEASFHARIEKGVALIETYPPKGDPFPALPEGFTATPSFRHRKYYFRNEARKLTSYKHPTNQAEYPATLQALFRLQAPATLPPNFFKGIRGSDVDQWMDDQRANRDENTPVAKAVIAYLSHIRDEPAAADKSRKRPREEAGGARGDAAEDEQPGKPSRPADVTLPDGWSDGFDEYPPKGEPFPSIPAEEKYTTSLSSRYGHYYFKADDEAEAAKRKQPYKHPVTGKMYKVTPQAFALENKMTAEWLSTKACVTVAEATAWLEDQRKRDDHLDKTVVGQLSIKYKV